jgi:AcrR family transcriptional regulator
MDGMMLPRGRGRPKLRSDEEQAEAIVKEALDLFVREGYGATTMDDIAAACHVSKRTLYRLFPSKIELFTALVEAHRQLMLEFPAHDPARSLEDQLAEVFRVEIDPASDRRRRTFIELAARESQRVPEIAEIIRVHGGEKTRIRLAAWLAERRDLALIEIDSPDILASMLMDIAFGAIVAKTGKGAGWPGGEDRPSYLRQCFGYVVNGIKCR